MKYEHEHRIFKGHTTCITCGLTKKTWKLLDKLEKEHKPYSNHCSSCGARVTDEEKFENFALARFDSIHTNCEKCIKLFNKYNK